MRLAEANDAQVRRDPLHARARTHLGSDDGHLMAELAKSLCSIPDVGLHAPRSPQVVWTDLGDSQRRALHDCPEPSETNLADVAPDFIPEAWPYGNPTFQN